MRLDLGYMVDVAAIPIEILSKFPLSPLQNALEHSIKEHLKGVRFNSTDEAKHGLEQWFSNCASRRPGASFQFFKGVAEYFGFVPLSLGFIASKEL